MAFEKIDKNSWKRKEYFEHYFTAVPCTYSMTIKVDITQIKKKGMKLYPTMLYYIATIVNRHSEFRTAINHEGVLGIYDEMIPCYTVFHEDTETFSDIWTTYMPDFDAFLMAYESDMRQYKSNHEMIGKPKQSSKKPFKFDSKLNLKVEYTTIDADYETEHKEEFEKLTESVMETVSEYGCKDTGVSEYRDKIEEYKNAKILFGIKTPAGKESAGLSMGYVSEWHQYYVLEVEGKIEFADFAIFSSSSNNVENEKVNVLDKNRRWFLIDRVDRTKLATGNELLHKADTKTQGNPQQQKQVVVYKQKEYNEENLG